MRLWSNYLNLLVAGGKLPLLEDQDVVSDPLQQHGDQLVIFLPTQLQLLKHRHTQRYNLKSTMLNIKMTIWVIFTLILSRGGLTLALTPS